MNIYQMTLSASVLIILIVFLRILARNKLPNKTFVALWGLVLVRLLIPFSIPTSFRFVALSNQLTTVRQAISEATIPILPIFNTNRVSDTTASSASQIINKINPLVICWMIGTGLLLVVFCLAFIKSYRSMREAIQVKDNEFINRWIEEQKLKRSIKVLSYDKITTPLTLGFIYPKIILPNNMDLDNHDQLNYVFSHELVHIKRLDTLWKLISMIAVCIHWFNPLVWLMYILFNRDLEIACDEKVISILGERNKSVYAFTLIGLAEQKSGFTSFYSGFGRNAIKERVASIMKYKKATILSVVLALALVFSAIFIFVFFSNPTNTKAKNEKAIQVVVEQLFTCPNEELIQLYNDMYIEMNESFLNMQNDPDAANAGFYSPDEEDLSSINKLYTRVEEMYAPYFTEKGYESFFEKLFYQNYNIYATALGYETEVKQIVITQSETIDSNYSFTVYLRYGPTNGEKKDVEIVGSAQVTEANGKLSFLQFKASDLFMELRDKGPSYPE